MRGQQSGAEEREQQWYEENSYPIPYNSIDIYQQYVLLFAFSGSLRKKLARMSYEFDFILRAT